MPMDAYNVEQLPTERLLLFVAATAGQVMLCLAKSMAAHRQESRAVIVLQPLTCTDRVCTHLRCKLINTRKLSSNKQGDPPDNMKRFWRFMLRKSLTPGSLSGVRFSVFGLGDSNYPKYNVSASQLFLISCVSVALLTLSSRLIRCCLLLHASIKRATQICNRWQPKSCSGG